MKKLKEVYNVFRAVCRKEIDLFSQYFGREFYSDELGCDCFVVRVVSNREWYFIAKNSPTLILKSRMPLDEYLDE